MIFYFFFFKQKTAYEMRISDWSSDVCSSDLLNQLSDIGRIKRRNGAGSDGLLAVVTDGRGFAGVIVTIKNEDATMSVRSGVIAMLEEIGRASCRERGCQYV